MLPVNDPPVFYSTGEAIQFDEDTNFEISFNNTTNGQDSSIVSEYALVDVDDTDLNLSSSVTDSALTTSFENNLLSINPALNWFGEAELCW